MSTTALIPSLEQDYKRQEEIIEEITDAQTGPTPIDKAIASLADHPGFKELENYINRRIGELQSYLDQAIANGADFTQIGQRAMVLKLCSEELSGIINYVKNRYRAVNDNLQSES